MIRMSLGHSALVPMIPNIIMQTWKTNDVPDEWKESPRSIQKVLPNWKYFLMTDEDNRKFVAEHFPDFLFYYDNFPYEIQRADAIRACWLYIHGGVYMDLDLVIVDNFEHLFNKDVDLYFVSSGNISATVTNSFMASRAGASFWLEYIEEMKNGPARWAIGKHFTVITSTGPLALSSTLNKTMTTYAMLPSKLFMPCSVCNINCDIGDAYLKPLYGRSWNGIDSHFFNWAFCNWDKIVIAVIIIIVILLIYLFWLWWRRNR